MIVYITGCCGGIGRHLVEQYVSERFFVVGIDLDQNKLNELSEKYGGYFAPCPIDLTKKSDTKNGIKKIIKQFGIPDIFINCAGIVSLQPFDQESEKKFYEVMEVNFLCIKRVMDCVIPIMEKKGGKFVNVASVAGFVSAPLLASYSASKSALISYSECIQQELRLKESRVKLIIVCPGFVQTPLIKMGDETGFPEFLKPLLSKPDKVAKGMIKAIREGKEYIDPTINGKVISFIERISPKAIGYLAKRVLPKGMKKLFKS